MKPSRYNHFFAADNTDFMLGYNAYSGALAEIEKQNHPRVLQLLRRPEDARSAEDRQFLQCLREGGFLIADGIDQTTALKAKARRARLEGRFLTLTIAPTLACNFNCDYCFESRSNVRMNENTQQALLIFSDRYLEQADGLRVCWFGGEPTLCMPLIEKLQTDLIALARKRQLAVIPGTIITNGYLLDAAMARRLKDLGIEQAQITIDGPQEVHDSRRKLHSGKGTFNRIVDNLSETAGILHITVRINVDRTNVASAYEVVDLLNRRGILPKVRIQFAQVRSTGTACANVRDHCYGDEEFSQTLVQIYDRLLSMGISQIEYPRVLSGAAFCGALSDGYYVVSPAGDLFRCWEELSTDSSRSIGNLFSNEPTEQQKRNSDAYRNWDPFALTECGECDILPVCMGGCPLRGIQSKTTTRGICLPWKYNLREMIRLKYACETAEPVNQ
ncbi:MAG: SPASM domain-containing protein [Candidatus Zixiibacteriota bacterium]|jgi:uncharacterized protein